MFTFKQYFDRLLVKSATTQRFVEQEGAIEILNISFKKIINEKSRALFWQFISSFDYFEIK